MCAYLFVNVIKTFRIRVILRVLDMQVKKVKKKDDKSMFICLNQFQDSYIR